MQLWPQPRQHLSSPGQSLSAPQVVTQGPIRSLGQGGEFLSRKKLIYFKRNFNNLFVLKNENESRKNNGTYLPCLS